MSELRLRPKYVVRRVNEVDSPGGPIQEVGEPMLATDPDNIDSPFVLLPRKDPAALAALSTYVRLCEPQLANEMRAWMRKIAEAEPAFGTQGKRNFSYIRSRLVNELDG